MFLISAIKKIEYEIIDQYLYDGNPERPWVLGFSGGKDSTMLLQLVWYALKNIDPTLRKRQVYVVCNNTLVENPKILQFVDTTLKKIEYAATQQGMPIFINKTTPKVQDSFWVKLIGLGYPSPSKFFRWCTDRLKIDPTTRFILDKINKNGEVIILLGTRKDESANRAASIKKYEVKGKRLQNHVLPNAYVYTPLKEIKTDELWQYLLQVPPPWGGSHRELITLYRNASGGDCPLIIDKTTTSCGNSRFGCWVCTVVNKDKSMEGLIDNGEEWMQPLLEIRDFLIETRDNPEQWRERTRRNGTISEGIWGPYKFETRVEILRRVLEAQKIIHETDENISLITQEELNLIQYYWFRDGFFKIKISDICSKIFNTTFIMDKYEEIINEERKLLNEVFQNEDEVNLVFELLGQLRSKTLLIRKKGLNTEIEDIIDSYFDRKLKDSHNFA